LPKSAVGTLAACGEQRPECAGGAAGRWIFGYSDRRAEHAGPHHAGAGARPHLPDAGLKGNSHLLMMEENNLEIADLLINWIEEN